MSPYYIKHFKIENPCNYCPDSAASSKAPGKQFCQFHLVRARLAWRVWAERRAREQLCITCTRPAWTNPQTRQRNCRCETHREMNRIKCQKWGVTHASERMQYERDHKERLISSGVCICSMRGLLKPGQRRCDECHSYNKARKAGDYHTVNAINRRRREARLALSRTRAKQAKKQLKAAAAN